jgi:hypothetical protein
MHNNIRHLVLEAISPLSMNFKSIHCWTVVNELQLNFLNFHGTKFHHGLEAKTWIQDYNICETYLFYEAKFLPLLLIKPYSYTVGLFQSFQCKDQKLCIVFV